MMVYKFKPGSRITADPEQAAKVLNQLADEDRLNPETLVDVSRPEEAPLHNEFEWNDGVAAEEWRKHQAQHIIACLTVVEEQTTREPVRAFFKLTETKSNYEPLHTIIQREDSTEALKRMCLKEFMVFKNKYSTILAYINANEKVTALQMVLEEAITEGDLESEQTGNHRAIGQRPGNTADAKRDQRNNIFGSGQQA